MKLNLGVPDICSYVNWNFYTEQLSLLLVGVGVVVLKLAFWL